MSSQIHIPRERYNQALTYMALVIDAYGEDFWPIFEVLENEYNLILERQKKIASRVKLVPPKEAAVHLKPKLVLFESA